jgi:hypothetical protein
MGNWNLHETLVVTRMPLRKPTRLKIDGCALIYRVPQLTKFLVDEQTPERRVTGGTMESNLRRQRLADTQRRSENSQAPTARRARGHIRVK